MSRTRALPRLRPAATRIAGWIAGRIGAGLRTVPGVGGALLVAYGAGLIYRPLLFIVGGVFLLLLDRRVP